MTYDMIVIGAGPAGISAAIYAKSRGLNVLVIEKNAVGGLIRNVSTVTHYTAITDPETGATFASRMKAQAQKAGIAVVYEEVTDVELSGATKKVFTESRGYETKTLILANGTTPRTLGIPGEKELAKRGIGLNAARDGASYRNKNIYVVGGADGALKEALYLAQYAKKLTVIHFEDQLGAISEFTEQLKHLSNASVRLHSRLTAVYGSDHVAELELTDVHTGEKERIFDDGCGIFVYAGTLPNTRLYTQLELADGFIPVNEKMETAIPGVYAAGDIRAKQVRQIATAVSDGAIAAINAAAYCKNPA